MGYSKPTKVIRWTVQCREHGHEGMTYGLAGDTYGRLMGRTPHNELAEFNSWEDPVFDAVGSLVDDLLRPQRETAECFGRVLGATCDPAPSGDQYDFTGRIYCPVCGSSNVDYREPQPIQVDVIDLAQVTHQAWERLDPEKKRTQLRDALRRVGCLR